jgi:hypothetical protein
MQNGTDDYQRKEALQQLLREGAIYPTNIGTVLWAFRSSLELGIWAGQEALE